MIAIGKNKVVSPFLKNQTLYLLQSPAWIYAWISIFAMLPYTSCLSLALVALVTLRKGPTPGLTAVLVGILAQLIPAFIGLGGLSGHEWALLAYLACFFAACLLKKSESWQVVLTSLLLVVWVGLILVQQFKPGYIETNFQNFLALVQGVNPPKELIALLANQAVRIALPYYLLGAEAISLVISALFPLIIARYLQALAFYPEGFRKEILAFRAHWLALLLFIMGYLFIRQGNLLAAFGMPLLALYLIVSGINLVFSLLWKISDRLILMTVVLPAIIVPYIAFPVYLLLGCFDSLVSVRSKKAEVS